MDKELQITLANLAATDVELLVQKDKVYKDSWKKRGGVGAAMMLARKWDRIEVALKENGYDIFAAIKSTANLMDDIIDLRCYLFLVQSEGYVAESAEPESQGYVNQDGPDMTIIDEAVDNVWDNMATDHAKKQTLRMGDSELLEYLEVHFDPSLDVDQKRTLLLNLQMFHQAVLTNQKPHRDLADIMDSCHAVLSYSNPYRKIPGLCDTC